MDNNKLIAEFMGVETTDGLVFQDNNTHEFNPIKYHREWNWLMPVVHEIDKICRENLGLNHNLHIGDNRAEVYLQVVEFIKEYNDEK
tara:strand:- start:2694 stop:2954 length:261 start_codon:yes stop_codon:yes gene_type:complete